MSEHTPIHKLGGAKPETGHFLEFLENPAHFLLRAYHEGGELTEIDLGGMRNVLMVGPDAHEAVFRAPDQQLSAAAPYAYMVPVFGEGIQYGAPLELERQQVKMQANALRASKMKGYAGVIAQEVEDWVANWGDEGEIDVVTEFQALVLRTSTHCLMGTEFRNKLTDEFGALYHDLECAVSAEAILDPYGAGEIFEKRDRARARLQEIVMDVIEERRAEGGGKEYFDMLDTFMGAEYVDGSKLPDEQIPGMVVWIMFGGFHTSSNTAAWTLVELARNPQFVPQIKAEVDQIFGGQSGGNLEYAAMREIPMLDSFVGEALRLHPPLCTLMRQVMQEFEYKGNTIPVGDTLVISPYVSHRVPEYFPDPERFDPGRTPSDNVFAYIPFGGGARKCVGNAFAMLQVKAIFCALLSRYEFEIVGDPEDIVDSMPSLILRPSDPCRVKYRRRS
jgi:sterol 14-demethylase